MKLQTNTPLFDAVNQHAKNKYISFHTPGHKNGRSIDAKLKDATGKKMYQMDITVLPTVDSLHDPLGAIKKAQHLLAKAYGVKQSFMLVNGSTVGNQAMFLSACNPGDSVIVSRNAHKSVMAGIILAGVWPIWIQPKIDQNLDIVFDVTPDQIEDAVRKFPEAKGIFITSPTYNGVTTDLIKISEIAHSHGKVLMVDEAHGAHLKFHPDLPISAVEAGADLCVQSTHKILSALSQGSVLHFNSDLVDANRVKKVVSMLQTTSPNYIILSSIDVARMQAYLHGERMLDRVIRYGLAARRKINRLNNFFSFTRNEISARGFDLDATKLTINVTRSGMSGYEVDTILREQYGIQVDCCDVFNLIAIMGIGTDKNDVDSLVEACEEIDKKYKGKKKNLFLNMPSLSTEMVMMPRDVFLSQKIKRVSLHKAVGHISAQALTPYPPGIPILIPGERISKEICDYLLDLVNKEIRISGQETDTLRTIKVVSV
ncbi:MAG: aminotransferase class I/II-fold pyridoxal phosphate-dependent enzyme [bacterium]